MTFIKKIKELNGVKCQLENDRVKLWKLVLLDYHCHERKPKLFEFSVSTMLRRSMLAGA